MVNNSTNINKTNNNISPKGSLNSDGQQLHQYQQNKNNVSPSKGVNIDVQQFNQYQHNKH
jgi:hypothetical protein